MEIKAINLSRYYFDHATSTPMFKSVKAVLVDKMDIPFAEERPLYASDLDLEKEIEMALKTIRSFFSYDEKDLVLFSPSYQEAVHFCFQEHLDKVVKKTGKNQIFYLPFEKNEMIHPIKDLEQLGCITEKIPLNKQGQIDFEALKEKITPKTSMISLSWAHPNLGIIQPLEELYQICQEFGIKLHLDVTQIVGKIYFRMQDLPIDYLTMNPGAIGGPSPFGVTVLKYHPDYKPMIGHIFTRSKDYSKLMAFSILCYEIMQLSEEFFFNLPVVKDTFEKNLLKCVPEAKILFLNQERLQSHSVVVFPRVHHEMFQYLLQHQKIFARIMDLENILEMIQIDPKESASAIVFSFGLNSSENDVLEACDLIASSYEKCKQLYQLGN